MKTQPVREQLLDQTLKLIRTRGYNGFSYRDLADLVGVKTSSIHYYFPSKEDLALEAARQYHERVAHDVERIDRSLSAAERAERYLDGWRKTADPNQVCMCGMLANEAASLPESVHVALKNFYLFHERWLTEVLEQARAEGAVGQALPPQQMAMVVFGALQSGAVAARLFQAPERLQAAADMLRAAVALPH